MNLNKKVVALLKAEQKFINSILNRMETLILENSRKKEYENTLNILKSFVDNFKEYLQLENMKMTQANFILLAVRTTTSILLLEHLFLFWLWTVVLENKVMRLVC